MIYAQNIQVDKLQEEFSIDQIIEMCEQDEYDPEKELFEIDFTDEQIKKIARAQLNLIVKDLQCFGQVEFESECYTSAYEYLKTDGFIELCGILGLSEEAARYTSKWFLYRYTQEYQQALKDAAEGEANPTYIGKTRFAYELANYLFEHRNKIKGFVNKYLSDTTTYWSDMSKLGLKSYCCRSMLTALFAANRGKSSKENGGDSEFLGIDDLI
ncbi:hypothetical protein DC915_RS02405 [Vibrio parahaemolyticus]|uniref:Uncharacterized protein n=1 Tax=Vibrio jasicida TaxID=766224 RepID=A0AAU9QVT0_9VIBR|nr:hypothetical protein [Vibrio parahaemolyticus]EJG0009828.1 hypothetical protein [Vibrio parahaemolyticus]CAH1598656.1 conserved hypothetical protein [Vibrio jasicida]CAH1601657.1 conserved hypothetical protein [Vibrio jasicida]